MSGATTYDNKYETMARNSIAKYPKEWLLSGFYNSMIVGKKKSYSTAYLYLSFVIRFLKQYGSYLFKAYPSNGLLPLLY